MKINRTWNVVDALDSDLDFVAKLVGEDMGMPRTGADVREADQTHPKDGISRRFKAIDDDGSALGFVTVRRYPFNPEGQFWIMLIVDPNRTDQGVGTSLLMTAESFARESGATHALSYVMERTRNMAFAAKNRYQVIYKLVRNELDLASFDYEPFRNSIESLETTGMRFITYAEWGDSPEHRRLLWEVCNVGNADCPDADLGFDPPFEDFEREHFAPSKNLDDRFLIVSDGLPVAMTNLERKACGKWVTDFTCTARSVRGQGLAVLVKAGSINSARERGASSIVTVNDQTNKPMLAVNARLGFLPTGTTCTIRRDFVPSEEEKCPL